MYYSLLVAFAEGFSHDVLELRSIWWHRFFSPRSLRFSVSQPLNWTALISEVQLQYALKKSRAWRSIYFQLWYRLIRSATSFRTTCKPPSNSNIDLRASNGGVFCVCVCVCILLLGFLWKLANNKCSQVTQFVSSLWTYSLYNDVLQKCKGFAMKS